MGPGATHARRISRCGSGSNTLHNTRVAWELLGLELVFGGRLLDAGDCNWSIIEVGELSIGTPVTLEANSIVRHNQSNPVNDYHTRGSSILF